MLRRWRLTATVLGLMAGFAACAKGEVSGPGGTSTASATSSTGGASTTSTSSGTGGMTASSTSSGTGGMTASSTSSGTGGSLCGNGMIDPGEDCDGTNFGTTSCQSLGLGSGTLLCNSACHLVVSGCQPLENCTNGVDDNMNGLIDCQDPQCTGMPGCVDSCMPTYPATLPGNVAGDTTGRPAVHHASCSSATSGHEQIFQVTAPASGTMSLDFSSCPVFNASVSVRTACDTDASEIGCSNKPDPNNFGDITLGVPVLMGQTYFVMVQGMTPQDFGMFSLILDQPLPESICDDLIDNDLNTFVDCDDPNCQTLPACVPGATATGQPCTINTSCTANHHDPICLNTQQWPGGYCSEFCDTTAQDCSAGNICYAGLMLSAHGVCLHECTLDTDCRTGYGCVDVGLASKVCEVVETLCDDYIDNDFDGLTDCQDPTSCQTSAACTPGSQAIGQPCTLHNQCYAAPGKNNPFCLDELNLVYPGGYCSHFCDPTVANDCGPNAICEPQGPNGENICMQTCTTAAQCRTGYACLSFVGYPKMICTL